MTQSRRSSLKLQTIPAGSRPLALGPSGRGVVFAEAGCAPEHHDLRWRTSAFEYLLATQGNESVEAAMALAASGHSATVGGDAPGQRTLAIDHKKWRPAPRTEPVETRSPRPSDA